MSVLGTSSESEKFLKSLDERKLVDLCADLLILEGHKEIKITEGPGDGQRDIHSQNAKGDGYLTQSKFHSNISQTVSARELGEVVLGMVRFGYKKGMFITNAKISPAAKRDCLNDYPGYSVDFIDGWELVKKVFGNLILKAIWYDGISLDRVSYTLIVPSVARDLETDKPLPLLTRDQNSFQRSVIDSGRTQVHALYQRSSVSTSVFGAYRSPRVRTVSELGASRINLTEVILSGVIHLEDIDNLLHKIGEEIVQRVKDLYASKHHFAILLGHPSLTPLGGEASGARIELNTHDPITIVSHDNIEESEINWIIPNQEVGWFLPEYASVSQADWIRWYNPKHDICFDVTVVSPPSDAIKWMLEEQGEYFLRWWNESLFMLLSATLRNGWAESNLPEPSSWHQWDNDNFLGAWLHPNLGLHIRPMQIEPDDEPSRPSDFQYDPEQVRNEIDNLRTQIEALGGIVIEPMKARYMVAVVDKDPFATTEITEYPGRQLVYEMEIIPSPIDPNSRRVEFTICWLLKSSQDNRQPSLSELNEFIETLSQGSYYPFNVTAKYDNHTLSEEVFLIAYIEYAPKLGFEKTNSFLERIEREIESVLLQLERASSSRFSIKRATEYYWDKEIFMNFRRG